MLNPNPDSLDAAPLAGSSAPPKTSQRLDLRQLLLTLLREFLVTVALAYITLLAVLQTVQYHVRLFLVFGDCARSPPLYAEASASMASYTSSAASSSPTSILSVLSSSPQSPTSTLAASCISSSCAPINAARISRQITALSPIDVLKITTVCAVLVFLGLEAGAWVARRVGWTIVPRSVDAEAGSLGAERLKGGLRMGSEKSSRRDVSAAFVQCS